MDRIITCINDGKQNGAIFFSLLGGGGVELKLEGGILSLSYMEQVGGRAEMIWGSADLSIMGILYPSS